MTPETALRRIQEALDSGIPAIELIESLQPTSTHEAISWVRHLSAWEDYTASDRAISVARIVSRRAMKEHGITITSDGRVMKGSPRMVHGAPPTMIFSMDIAGEEVRVEYMMNYSPMTGTDHFQFRSSHEPVRAMPLSETGWWSQFAPHDAVEACGGAEEYVKLLVAAKMDGRLEEFDAVFKGKRPEETKRVKKVVGKHTEEVVEKTEAKQQGALF